MHMSHDSNTNEGKRPFQYKQTYLCPGHTLTDHLTFYYGLNLKDDPGNANFRSPIRMHYIGTV